MVDETYDEDLYGVPHKQLMCGVVDIHYSFLSHTGTLVMGMLSCTDMNGCVRFFQGIDPDVSMIFTIAGNKPDTAYKRQGKDPDAWQAIHLSDKDISLGETVRLGEP